MMPPDQQETTTTVGSSPPNMPLTNRSENALVHAEPSAGTCTSCTNVTPPLVDDQMPEQQAANTARLSILQKSLRPITLKVRTYTNYLHKHLLA
jgi:hypothetical protein